MPFDFEQLYLGLYQDGGLILLSIFFLSVFLYATAFKSLLQTAYAARPFSKLVDMKGHDSSFRRFGEPWNSLIQALDSEPRLEAETIAIFKRIKESFNRNVNTDLLHIKIIIAAAPLLGLLGTIIGMIETFDAISGAAGSGTASMVANGISKALITTSAGLMVALPALFITFLIRRKLKQAIVVVETVEAAYFREAEHGSA